MGKPATDIDYWLRLWGNVSRDINTGLGYPKQATFYTPPQNYADEKSDGDATEYDWLQVSRIEDAMKDLWTREPTIFQCLREYYGAYPGADQSRKVRLKNLGMGNREIYQHCDTGRQILRGSLLILERA